MTTIYRIALTELRSLLNEGATNEAEMLFRKIKKLDDDTYLAKIPEGAVYYVEPDTRDMDQTPKFFNGEQMARFVKKETGEDNLNVGIRALETMLVKQIPENATYVMAENERDSVAKFYDDEKFIRWAKKWLVDVEPTPAEQAQEKTNELRRKGEWAREGKCFIGMKNEYKNIFDYIKTIPNTKVKNDRNCVFTIIFPIGQDKKAEQVFYGMVKKFNFKRSGDGDAWIGNHNKGLNLGFVKGWQGKIYDDGSGGGGDGSEIILQFWCEQVRT